MTHLTPKQLACNWARDPEFLAWLSALSGSNCTSDDAADFIRSACGIESRRELDTNRAAAALFELHVRRNFVEWRMAHAPQSECM